MKKILQRLITHQKQKKNHKDESEEGEKQEEREEEYAVVKVLAYKEARKREIELLIKWWDVEYFFGYMGRVSHYAYAFLNHIKNFLKIFQKIYI